MMKSTNFISQRNDNRAWLWAIAPFAFGLLLMLSVFKADAAVPKKVKDDTALYQEISEIKVKKTHPGFRKELNQLAQLESRYAGQELAQHPRLKNVIKRITDQKYSYSKKARPSSKKK